MSLGCGYGDKEIWLAKKNPNLNITCIDNAPFTNKLNLIAKELNLKNIFFIKKDLNNLNFSQKFDVIFCWAVIYCLDDKNLKNFYESIYKLSNNSTRIYLGTTALISPYQKTLFYFKKLLKIENNKNQNLIITGWQRDKKEILNYITEYFQVINTKNFDLTSNLKFLIEYKIIYQILSLILHIVKCNIFSSTILFKLKK